ncbi:MAG: patatin-like phospholipase family protein, partial [Acidobacteriota bacterium]
PIDCIVGTSFGSLVGGLYALGYSSSDLERIFTATDWLSLFSDAPERRITPLFERRDWRYQGQVSFDGLTPQLPTGLLVGQRLTELLNSLSLQRLAVVDYDFDRLPIPFRAVATDLVTGEPYVFKRGRLTEALRASIAIPMVFTPVEKDGMLLVDGGLVDNLPTGVARAMGADIVIAVDVTSPLRKKDEIRTFFDVIDQSISLQIRDSVGRSLQLADVVLRPDLEGLTAADYGRFSEIIERGAREAEARLHAIRAAVGGRRQEIRAGSAQSSSGIEVESVRFEGLRRVPASRLGNEIRTRAGEPLDFELLQEDMRRLYATRLFEQVDSELRIGGGGRYQVDYLVKESPLNTLGGAIRYDREYKFVALAEYTARQLFHSPSALTVSAQFGGYTDVSAGLRYIPSDLPFLFVEPKVHYRRRERLDIRNEELEDRYSEKRKGGQIVVGGSLFRRTEFEFGYRVDQAKVSGGTVPNRQEEPRRLAGFTFRLNRDTLTEAEFPERGMRGRLQVDERRPSLGSDFGYGKYQASYEQFVPLSDPGTLQVRGDLGYTDGDIPFYDQFYLGGYSLSQGGPRQMMGYRLDELLARQVGLVSIAYRHRLLTNPLSFARRVYLTGTYNVAAWSREKARPYRFQYAHGFGLALSFDTLVGPIHFAGGWGESGRFNFYLTLGPGF